MKPIDTTKTGDMINIYIYIYTFKIYHDKLNETNWLNCK